MGLWLFCLLKDKDFTNKKNELKKPLYEKKNNHFHRKRKEEGNR